jgi:hypothetical protein
MASNKISHTTKEGASENLLHTVQQLEKQLDQSATESSEKLAKVEPVQTLQPEVPAAPEQIRPVEQALEKYKQVQEDRPEESPYVIKRSTAKDAVVVTNEKTQELKDIEQIMAKDLEPMFEKMTPQQQAKFKKRGEEVAKRIVDMVDKFTFTVKKVLGLIRAWLKIIPGVNRFFLEQSAKIKAEELLNYTRRKHSK